MAKAKFRQENILRHTKKVDIKWPLEYIDFFFLKEHSWIVRIVFRKYLFIDSFFALIWPQEIQGKELLHSYGHLEGAYVMKGHCASLFLVHPQEKSCHYHQN